MSYFPMMVNLEGVRVLVVGGGEEGRKKVEILSSFGAKITLIAKNAAEEAVGLADRFLGNLTFTVLVIIQCFLSDTTLPQRSRQFHNHYSPIP